MTPTSTLVATPDADCPHAPDPDSVVKGTRGEAWSQCKHCGQNLYKGKGTGIWKVEEFF